MVQLSPSKPGAAVEGTIELADGTRLDWDDLYADLGPAVESYARSRGVRDPEDLVQDVFVDLFRRSADFTGDTSGLRSLLFTIAYRRIADVHRRTSRRPEVLVPVPLDAPSGSSDGPGVEEVVVSTETLSAALDALSALTERERSVITMRIFEEASPEEVSRRLGLTNVNVRVIQARACRKVRAALEARGHLRDPLAVLMSVTSLRHVSCRLPSKGVLGRWVEEMQAGDVGSHGPIREPARVAPHESGFGDQAAEVWSQLAMRTAVVVSALTLGAAVVIPGWVPAGGPGGEGSDPSEVPVPGVIESMESRGANDPGQPSEDMAVPAVVPPDVFYQAGSPQTPGSSGVGVVDPSNRTMNLLLADVDGTLVHVVSTLAGQAVETLLDVTEATLADASGAVFELVDTVADTPGAVVENAGDTAERATEVVASTADEVIETTDEVVEGPIIDAVVEQVEETVGNGGDALLDPVDVLAESVDEVVTDIGSVSEGGVDDVVDEGLGLFD